MASLNIAEFTKDQAPVNKVGFRGRRGGGRGGFAGRGGRQSRGDFQKERRTQVNLDDKTAFPSLA